MHSASVGTSVKAFKGAGRAGLPAFDWALLGATIGLLVMSAVTLVSATRDDIPGNPQYFVIRQIVYASVGVVLMVAVSRIDYTRFRDIKAWLYGTAIASIVLVLVFGGIARGSRRWIELPFFKFQPSELGKILLILALSAFVVDRYRRLSEKETTVQVLALGLLPSLLVLVQPDLGTALVYVVITLAILFVAGTKWSHFAVIGAATAVVIAISLVALPAVGVNILKPYQQERLTAFLNPGESTSTTGYQQNQSVIAVGSGGRSGRGEKATQTRLNFLPEHHTDFIYAVVGEQYGFIGAAIVLCLYAVIIWRGLRILTLSKNLYGALVAGGIVAMLMFQVFIGVGMAIRIAPITGLPLPLMSYGGSSVIVTLLALGLLQSIYAQGWRPSAAKSSEIGS